LPDSHTSYDTIVRGPDILRNVIVSGYMLREVEAQWHTFTFFVTAILCPIKLKFGYTAKQPFMYNIIPGVFRKSALGR